MASENIDLNVIVNAIDKTGGALSQIGRGFRTLGKTLGLAVAGLGAAAVGVTAAGLKMAADFDQSMRNVNAIAQLPEDQFTALKDAVLDFSLTTRASSGDVANALYNVVSAGFATDQAFDIMTASSRAAGAGLASTEDTSRLLIAALRSYNLDVSDADRVTDIFLQTVNQGITTLPELANGLGRILPAASNLGVGLEEVGFSLARMTQTGLSTDEAVTRLNSLFVQMLKPSEALQGAIEDLGFATGVDMVNQLGGVIPALSALKDGGFTPTADAIAELFPNIRAMGGAMAILGDDAALAEGAVEDFGKAAEGAVERAREQQYASLSAQIAKVKSAFEVAGIRLGETLLPALTLLVTQAVPAIQKFVDRATEKISELQPFFEDVAGFIVNLIKDFDVIAAAEVFPDHIRDQIVNFWSTLTDVGDYILANKDAIIGALKGIAAAFAIGGVVLVLTSFLSGIGPTILAITAVAALLGAAWETNWLGIRDTLTSFWETTGRPMFEQLSEWLSVNLPLAIAALSEFWTTTLLPALQNLWSWVQANLFPLFEQFRTWLATNIPIAIAALTAFWEDTLLPALTNVWSWMQNTLFPALSELWAWLSTNIPEAIAAVVDWWENKLLPAMQDIWDFISVDMLPIWVALGDYYETVFSKAVELVTGLFDLFKTAIHNAWMELSTNLQPLIEIMADFWENTFAPGLEAVWEIIDEKILSAFRDVVKEGGGVKGIIEKIAGFFDNLAAAVANFDVQKLLAIIAAFIGQSPSPLERGLSGINRELRRMKAMGGLSPFAPSTLAVAGSAGAALAPTGAGMGGGDHLEMHFHDRRGMAWGMAMAEQMRNDAKTRRMGG